MLPSSGARIFILTLDLTQGLLYPKSVRLLLSHFEMNVRTFLTTSSLVLLSWMTASYFSAVPLENYAGDSEQESEITFAKSKQTVAELK